MDTGGLKTSLYRLMCVDEMIHDANAAWEGLREKCPPLGKYRDCGDFFERIVDASRAERETILFRIWDKRHGQFDDGDATVMILLCYPEFEDVFRRRVSRFLNNGEKLQMCQAIIVTFLERLAEEKSPIIDLQKIMGNELARIRRQFTRKNELFFSAGLLDGEFFENIEETRGVSPDAEYRILWNLIENAVQDKKHIAWIKILVRDSVDIPEFDESAQEPTLPQAMKCKIRDKIAEAVICEIPRLRMFVKTKQAGKRRRNYEQF